MPGRKGMMGSPFKRLLDFAVAKELVRKELLIPELVKGNAVIQNGVIKGSGLRDESMFKRANDLIQSALPDLSAKMDAQGMNRVKYGDTRKSGGREYFREGSLARGQTLVGRGVQHAECLRTLECTGPLIDAVIKEIHRFSSRGINDRLLLEIQAEIFASTLKGIPGIYLRVDPDNPCKTYVGATADLGERNNGHTNASHILKAVMTFEDATLAFQVETDFNNGGGLDVGFHPEGLRTRGRSIFKPTHRKATPETAFCNYMKSRIGGKHFMLAKDSTCAP